MALWYWTVEHRRVLLATSVVGLVAVLFLLVPLACGPQSPTVSPGLAPIEHRLLTEVPTVRVLLGDRLKGAKVPTLQCAGRVTFERPGGRALAQSASLVRSSLATQASGIRVGSFVFAEPVVFVRTGKGGTIQVGSKSYRGDLELRRRADGSLMLINHVDLESYLLGVVAGEMPNWWPAQALKAQAVVSRSYAYALLVENNGGNLFDVTANFRTSQVYEGIAGETSATDRAVRDTHGAVLTYNGKPFRAYFSSTCGGHTEACGLVWDDYATIAPLSGVECPYCADSRWNQPWQVSFSERQIREALGRVGRKVSAIRNIRFTDRNEDGHLDRVEVVHQRGTLGMRGNDFRLAVGPGKLKSMMCRVESSDGRFTFSGRGFGHGVGMCQFGALGMAKQDKFWEEVVHHYYPGCEIWKIYR